MPSSGYALTTTFANESGQQPASQLDVNFGNLLTPLNALGTYANYFLDSGTVNTLVITVPSPLSVSYAAGLILQVKVGNTNTGAVTLNVNGLGAQSVVYPNGSALAAGQLVAGGIAIVMYDGTNFQLLGAVVPPGTSAQRIYKATSTSRSSTTSRTADPDLSLNLIAGVYLIEMCVLCNATNATNGGIAIGVFSSNLSGFLPGLYPYATQGAQGVKGPGGFIGFAALDGPTADDVISFQGIAFLSGTGTVSVNWGQETSNANATTVIASSYLGAIPLTSA